MKEISFGQDGDFSEERFRDTVNASLANDIGNLVNRCLGLLKKNCDSKFPVSAGEIPFDHPMQEVVARSVPAVKAAYENLAFHTAIDTALLISRRYVRRSASCCGLILFP
jgi:methionyl-tRNA synthetase